MGFALRDHTADVAVEAWGESLGETFAAVADGMAAAMCESIPGGGSRFEVEVVAEGLEAALFDYLDELIYQRDVRGVLPVDNLASVDREGDRWTVVGSARGLPIEAVNAREVKAVTYSEMVLEEQNEGWHAYVVLDV